MKIFLLLFIIFAAFPTLIFGIECAINGICYALGFTGKETFVLRKTCNDSCVYFKCINSKNYGDEMFVTEGAGCYEDFVDSCKYIPTKYKDEILSNLKNYSTINELLIFKSCSDKDGCATTNGFNNYKTDNSSDGIFGSFHSRKILEHGLKFDTCPYLYSSKADNSPLQCTTYVECRPAKEYAVEYEYKFHGLGDKKCDGCFYFKCSNDGGNTVINGEGCFDDFEYACPTVPNDVKEKMKENAKDSYYFDKNYIVISSSYQFFYSKHLPLYTLVNPKAEEIFQANLKKDFDEQCHAELPQQNTSNASKLHENLIIFVFAFIYFWLYS